MAFKMKGPGKKRSVKELNKDPNVRQQVYLFGNPRLRVGSFKPKNKK